MFLLASVMMLPSVFGQNTEDRKDRITASYLIAFGVLPEQGEIDYWIKDPLSNKTVSDLVTEHTKNIGNQQSLQDRAIKNSYQDAFGRAPLASEYATWRPIKVTYTELMARHMKFLQEYPSSFEEVIKLSYKKEFGRAPKPAELANWKSWGVRSYLNIVQEHQKNKKAGMFAKKQSSSAKLISSKESGVRFTPSARISLEIGSVPKSNVISTGGGNVISTGGGNVISTGGGNVISTGGGN